MGAKTSVVIRIGGPPPLSIMESDGGPFGRFYRAYAKFILSQL